MWFVENSNKNIRIIRQYRSHAIAFCAVENWNTCACEHSLIRCLSLTLACGDYTHFSHFLVQLILNYFFKEYKIKKKLCYNNQWTTQITAWEMKIWYLALFRVSLLYKGIFLFAMDRKQRFVKGKRWKFPFIYKKVGFLIKTL